MLTVKAPIEIKAKTTYTADPDAFYKRIIGNYSLMETHLDGEDLLHLSVTPPEIYIQEGEAMTSILNTSRTNVNNQQKVEVINNLLNRIVVSADAHISYQDRVFITDALYKMGIRDDRRFMKAFYEMAEETKNTNTLINLYLERGMQVRELLESIENRVSTTRPESEEETVRERENFLYQNITDRLMTGAIYQIVSNFNRSTEENEIDSREYQIANQSYLAQHILLSVLRQRTGITKESLIYLTDNTYEESLEQSSASITNVRNEMNGAIMLDMLKNIYHTGFDRFFLNDNRFYRFEDVFYGASVNTLNRLSQYQGDTSFSMRVNSSFVDESTTLMSSEISLLENNGEEEGLAEDELLDITRRVNEINLRNEERRQQYMQILREVKTAAAREEPPDKMEKTRQTGLLALTSPDRLIDKLNEEAANLEAREKRILKEVASILPENVVNVYELISRYQENPEEFIENNYIRRGVEGELIYDIREAERLANEENAEKIQKSADQINEFVQLMNTRAQADAGIPSSQRPGATRFHTDTYEKEIILGDGTSDLVHDRREAETSAAREAVDMAKKAVEDAARIRDAVTGQQARSGGAAGTYAGYEAAPTIHKSTEAITEEELEEQLSVLMQDVSKQIKMQTSSDTVTEHNVVNNRQVINTETVNQTLNERQIRQMIDAGVKAQMSAISNQVFKKMESQMRNEKIRRGY